MIYSVCCWGLIRLNLAERSRKRCLYLTKGAVLEGKERVMMVRGEGKHTQEEA